MANPKYAHYSIEDFDKFDCLKLSKGVYLLLIFVLRGYLVWLMSVTNMQDRVGVMEWIYPETSLFYLSLISGALGLFVVLVISLRRPDAPNWVKYCWKNCRVMLVLALLFDLIVDVIAFYFFQMLTLSWLIMHLVIAVSLILFCFINTKFQINISEFPEKLPQ